jgi:allophanate hydrolase
MSVLPTVPAKPAITRLPDGAAGAALLGHRWLLSPAALGTFLGADISAYGSWPAAIAAGAVS